MSITKHTVARRREIAMAIGIEDPYAYQIINGIGTASPALARAWHKEEPGDRLWDLRPNDWYRIWPELVGTPGAPAVPAVQEA